MATKKKSKTQLELEAAGPLGKKALKEPEKLTVKERKTLAVILGKARAYQAWYRNTGKAAPKR